MKKRRFWRITAAVLGTIALLITAGLAYVSWALPDVGPAPADLRIASTPALVARGEYLATHVMACMDCHSARDWSRFSGPVVAGTFGQGGEVFDQKEGLPGRYYSPNITPAGVGDWTDGELYRAITCGVSRDGRALFPIMPHPYYGQMASEDIQAIVAYVRSLKPVAHQVPQSESDFPMNFIVNTIPQPARPKPKPDQLDPEAYGEYLVLAAACQECHSPVDKGQIIAGREFSGGREFPFPDGTVVRSANITPAPKTGLGSWTREAFVRRFKAHADAAAEPTVPTGGFNTVMPWTMYAGMTEQDLSAIYAYLQTLKPVENQVTQYSPAVASSR